MSSNQGFSAFPSERTFNLDYTSETDGQRYQGMFTVKRPTMVDQIAVEAEKSKMLGGKYFDEDNPGVGVSSFANQMAEGVSFLRVCLTNAPEWWNDGDVFDPNLLLAIYVEAQQVDPFRKVESKSSEGSGGESRKDSDRKHNKTDANDLLEKMVDEEI